MIKGKKKLLPKIVIGAKKDEVDLESSHNLEYSLELLDGNGNSVTSFKAVDDNTKAILRVKITNTAQGSNFADPEDFLTYRFVDEGWLEKDLEGNLKFSQDKEKKFKEKINRMYGNFVKKHGEKDFNLSKGGKTTPEEGLKDTDMQYKIETNDTPSVPGSPGIRIDIYPASGANDRRPIVENKVEVRLILNKKVQVDLEKDGLIIYSVQSKPKLKLWQIGLIGLGVLAVLALILGIIFHQQIREWWKKKKNKKEEQLEVF